MLEAAKTKSMLGTWDPRGKEKKNNGVRSWTGGIAGGGESRAQGCLRMVQSIHSVFFLAACCLFVVGEEKTKGGGGGVELCSRRFGGVQVWFHLKKLKTHGTPKVSNKPCIGMVRGLNRRKK